jgi:peptidoglycan/LPS O-acetylase OafA/YrhL
LPGKRSVLPQVRNATGSASVVTSMSDCRFSKYGDPHFERPSAAEAGNDARVREPSSAEHLPSLTPLRGIAALWVVLFHYCWHFPAIHPDRYTGAVYKGYLAVDLFFMLSGFVISHVYHRVFARQVTGEHYRDFLKARVARIYPLHLIVLLLFAVTAIGERAAVYVHGGSFGPIPLVGERSLGGFLANLLMLQGVWARELSWNDPAWSISLEFLAYLLFPLLFPVLWRAAPAAKAGTAGFLLLVLGWLAYRTGDDFNQWNGIGAIMRCLPEFLIGALLYSAYRGRLFATVLASDAALLAGTLLLCAMLHLAAPDFSIIPLFALLILTSVGNRGRLGRLLNSALFLWLGNISYSLYLIHWFVLFVTTEAVRGRPETDIAKLPAHLSLAVMAAMVTASLVLATLSYRFVEVAGRRWLRGRLGVRRFGSRDLSAADGRIA